MRNWSQAELADRLDVSRQAVNAIETGKYDPSLPLAFKLARLFAMPIEEIFDDGHKGDKDVACRCEAAQSGGVDPLADRHRTDRRGRSEERRGGKECVRTCRSR